MPPPLKKRKLNRHITARENADNLLSTDKYDVETWMKIINRADKESSLDDQRHILTQFLNIFPTSARQWKHHIEIEMHNKNYAIATDLFKKCINNKCFDVELYQVYIALCKKINESLLATQNNKDMYLSNLNEAYKFAIKQIGQDIKSTPLWRSYIHFLRTNASILSAKHSIADITLETRKVYHRVIALPIYECEKLWDEYILWEKSKNAQLASAYYEKFKHLHELTKQCYLDRKRYRRGVLLHIHTVPSNNAHAQERNYQQIQLWKRFIDFELLNKQNLSKTELWRRMEFTFRQSLMTMSLFPDIWLMYIDWTAQTRGKERTVLVFKQCLNVIPKCLLIQFKYFEFLELNYTAKETDEAYLNLLQSMPSNTLVYIQYLYFLRRCKNTNAARNFFIQTIQCGNNNKFWQLYVALGHIEEYQNNDSACAMRIFQNGFKYFKDKAEFVVCYVRFLMNRSAVGNDKQSKNELQTIFENILPQLDSSKKETKEIWKFYMTFQQRFSDLNGMQSVFERRNEEMHCNRIGTLLHSIDRFTFLDLLPVSTQYRDTLLHAQQTSQRKANQKLTQSRLAMAMHSNRNKSHSKDTIEQISILANHKRNTQSQIRVSANSEMTNEAWTDMTGFIDDSGDIIEDSVVMPDLDSLIAFKPGIRFLQNLNDANEESDTEKEKGDCEDDDEMGETENDKLLSVSFPKIKELLDKLPPPQHTQLLKVEKINKSTCMIDVDSFITFMKLKFVDSDILL